MLARLLNGAELVICADGAANLAINKNIIPNAIVGDFDSITTNTKNFYTSKSVQFIHDLNQDTTDLEKCLAYLESFNPHV